MSDMTLVLLAAGMGSRYGGLKQIEPFGPSGETLMDYSIFDADRAGFDRVVFVIRRDFEAAFREQVASRHTGALKVELAFQDLADVPAGRTVPKGRVKPWGTGHALYAARQLLDGPFAVINADDFYGREGFTALAGWLAHAKAGEAALVTYDLGPTLSAHGTVSRGICAVKDGRLLSVTERIHLRPADGAAFDEDAPAGRQRLALDCPVSLNLWGFHASFKDALEAGFTAFFDRIQDPMKDEFQLPGEVNRGLKEGWLTVRALAEGRRWFGITYPDDKAAVRAALQDLVAGGAYPPKLFA